MKKHWPDLGFILSIFLPMNKNLNLPASLAMNKIGITIYSDPKENLTLDEKN